MLPETPTEEAPPLQAPEAPEAPTIRELHAAGRKKIEKARRATQSKVRADEANEAAARAYAEKKIKQMEAEGRI